MIRKIRNGYRMGKSTLVGAPQQLAAECGAQQRLAAGFGVHQQFAAEFVVATSRINLLREPQTHQPITGSRCFSSEKRLNTNMKLPHIVSDSRPSLQMTSSLSRVWRNRCAGEDSVKNQGYLRIPPCENRAVRPTNVEFSTSSYLVE
jgi:hypothetical protein